MTVTDFRVGQVVARGFSSFFANLAGLVPLAVAAASAALLAGFLAPTVHDAAPPGGDGEALVAAMETDPLSTLAFVVVSAIAWLWLSAGVTYGVVSHLRGRGAGGVEILLRSLSFVPNLLLLTLVVVATAGILFAVALVVPVVGAIVFFVGGVWLYTVFWVAVPAIVVEGVGPVAGLARSARLTGGRRWRVLGAIALWFLVSLVIDLVLGAVLAGVRMAAGDMDGESAGFLATVLDGVARVVLLGLGAAVAAVGYHDLRVIEEGAG